MPSGGDAAKVHTALALVQSLVVRFKDNFPSVVVSAAATGWLNSVLKLGGIVESRKYTIQSSGFLR
ncbi:MFS quinate transporter [Pyrenophora tritici-repentis]